jgi:hypothetical protein
MSGWQRIGVLISVLWFVGMPIYLMVDTNNTAEAVYQSCIRSADLAFEPGGFEGDNPGELKSAERRCARSYNNMRMSPRKLMRLLLGREGEETLTVWTMILVPIVLFWLVGGATFATVRWIRRRLASSENT